jgi:hypothetical protein
MRITYTYAGEPSATLVINIPKLRQTHIEAKKIVEIRQSLFDIVNAVSEDDKAGPDTYATAIFKTVRAARQDIVISNVIFTIKLENGSETTLHYSPNDLLL